MLRFGTDWIEPSLAITAKEVALLRPSAAEW